MIFWFWDFDTDEYYGGGHLIENNYFENYTIAIFINSFQNNNTIRNNNFEGQPIGEGEVPIRMETVKKKKKKRFIFF